ncbi:hypothetical protein ACJRO7_033789 [Eucalyptus globulus]|uniref:Uncharacterized protein n=1 Tax=Eucalyptus globulus TaxID=34317 RepID=A0ABD3J1M6_EUCGL
MEAESSPLCSSVNPADPRIFVADRRGEVGYLAFSGFQAIDGSEPSCGTLMVLGEFGCEHLFSPLECDGEGMVKVDAGFLRLLLEFYQRQDFQNRIQEFLAKVKMIILIGHSFGATTASLTALWFLSHLQPVASPISVLCLTFSTPLLGNESLYRAILRNRWGGSFCNVVSKLDVVPKLFFAPLTSLTPQLHLLLQFWQDITTSPSLEQLVGELRKQNFDEFFSNIKDCVKDVTQSEEEGRNNLFWPLGSYLFFSEEGAIYLDNATSVVKMMHLMLEIVSSASSFEDHLKYSYYTRLFSSQFLERINVNCLSESSQKANVFLALQSSGIDPQDDNISKTTKDCLQKARHMGCSPNLNSAHLAIRLSKRMPCRTQLEWYKARCDESKDQLGYYNTFKIFEASRRQSIVDLNLFLFAAFWDDVMHMAEQNKLSHDFQLDISLHSGMMSCTWRNKINSHTISTACPIGLMHRWNGRNRKFQILDIRWNRTIAVVAQVPRQINNKRSRSRYASLTQDSLFWARVEELELLLANNNGFEKYAEELIEGKEVSVDVLVENSSY